MQQRGGYASAGDHYYPEVRRRRAERCSLARSARCSAAAAHDDDEPHRLYLATTTMIGRGDHHHTTPSTRRSSPLASGGYKVGGVQRDHPSLAANRCSHRLAVAEASLSTPPLYHHRQRQRLASNVVVGSSSSFRRWRLAASTRQTHRTLLPTLLRRTRISNLLRLLLDAAGGACVHPCC